MLKKLVLTGLLLSIQPARSSESNIDKQLTSFLQEIANTDDNLTEIIKISFGVTDPILIEHLLRLLDPVQIGTQVLKEHYTEDELNEIINFYRSETGRKFSLTFPKVTQAFSKALDNRIELLQAALVEAIKPSLQAEFGNLDE